MCLREAVEFHAAARLASLVNVKRYALELGADEAMLACAHEEAAKVYFSSLGLHLLDTHELTPERVLQSDLTELLHLYRRAALVEDANELDRLRLNSFSTTHAISWTAVATNVLGPYT